MSKHLSLLPLMAAVCIFLSACKPTGRTLPSATGSIYECVVVTDQRCYDTVAAVMAADMPCLPQMEPYFTVSRVSPNLFDDFLKSARNVLLVDINPNRYTTSKAVYRRDYWSKPQAVCRLQAPDTAAFVHYWQQYGPTIREWFVREELARQIRFLRGSINKEVRTSLQQYFGCDMLIPEDYMLIMDTTLTVSATPHSTLRTNGGVSRSSSQRTARCEVRVLWCCNAKGSIRRDLMVYTYPYTDTLTTDNLCFMRDEVMSRLVSGSVEGSFMGTEYKHFPPQMRYVQPIEETMNPRETMETGEYMETMDSSHSFYAAELRGLWRLYGGEAMGGPFVSLTQVVDGDRILTAEAFIYAAGQKKRNALRQAEAILYSFNS